MKGRFIMKKLVAAVLTSMMVLSLAGCGKTGIAGAADNWVSEENQVEATKLDDGSYYYEGRMGSTMKTAWFDYSIDSAYYTTDEIGGYSASEGNELVVVELTLKNTFEESVPMYYGDFELEWGDGDDEYTYSITDEIMDDQYPEQYDLKVNETRTGYLVFEAPEGTEDFSIGFVEYYENDTEGNGFWVYFTADEK